MAFGDAFSMTFTMKYDLEALLQCFTSASILRNSKLQFDNITEASVTTEKRLRIELQDVKNANLFRLPSNDDLVC